MSHGIDRRQFLNRNLLLAGAAGLLGGGVGQALSAGEAVPAPASGPTSQGVGGLLVGAATTGARGLGTGARRCGPEPPRRIRRRPCGDVRQEGPARLSRLRRLRGPRRRGAVLLGPRSQAPCDRGQRCLSCRGGGGQSGCQPATDPKDLAGRMHPCTPIGGIWVRLSQVRFGGVRSPA